MKTIVEFKNGGMVAYDTRWVYKDLMPHCAYSDKRGTVDTLYLVDAEENVVGDTIPLAAIKRITFENED